MSQINDDSIQGTAFSLSTNPSNNTPTRQRREDTEHSAHQPALTLLSQVASRALPRVALHLDIPGPAQVDPGHGVGQATVRYPTAHGRGRRRPRHAGRRVLSRRRWFVIRLSRPRALSRGRSDRAAAAGPEKVDSAFPRVERDGADLNVVWVCACLLDLGLVLCEEVL